MDSIEIVSLWKLYQAQVKRHESDLLGKKRPRLIVRVHENVQSLPYPNRVASFYRTGLQVVEPDIKMLRASKSFFTTLMTATAPTTVRDSCGSSSRGML